MTSIFPTRPGRYFDFDPATARAVMSLAREYEEREHVIDLEAMSDRDACLIAHATATRAYNVTAQQAATPVVKEGLRRIRDYIDRESVPTRPIQVVDWDHPRTRRAVAQLERERAR